MGAFNFAISVFQDVQKYLEYDEYEKLTRSQDPIIGTKSFN